MEKSHKKLKVWQEAIDLVTSVYNVTEKFPDSEKFGLTIQMRRAAVSIPSNIAEGAARQGMKDALQFFVISRGSLSELDTQLEIISRLHIVDDGEIDKIQKHIDTVDALLSGLIKYRRTMQ
ncbi:MAG: four helix bundle protein [Bacteroidota bacterium]